MCRTTSVLAFLLAALTIVNCGCNTTANLIDGAGNALTSKAQHLRLAQARFTSTIEEKRQKAQDQNCQNCCDDNCKKNEHGKCCLHDGELKETLETEFKIVLENGLQLNDFRLDFEKVKELAKEQARYDEEYEKAMKAWHDYEAENLRRHMAVESEKAKATASGNLPAPGCNPCAPSVPNCAIPPEKAYVKSAPPKRRAVGLDDIPIVINASAKLNVASQNYGKSNVRRDFVRAKEPCCPQCGTSTCDGRCESCGFISMMAQYPASLTPSESPPAAPPSMPD